MLTMGKPSSGVRGAAITAVELIGNLAPCQGILSVGRRRTIRNPKDQESKKSWTPRRNTQLAVEPKIIIVKLMGLPGSGKSTVWELMKGAAQTTPHPEYDLYFGTNNLTNSESVLHAFRTGNITQLQIDILNKYKSVEQERIKLIKDRTKTLVFIEHTPLDMIKYFTKSYEKQKFIVDTDAINNIYKTIHQLEKTLYKSTTLSLCYVNTLDFVINNVSRRDGFPSDVLQKLERTFTDIHDMLLDEKEKCNVVWDYQLNKHPIMEIIHMININL